MAKFGSTIDRRQTYCLPGDLRVRLARSHPRTFGFASLVSLLALCWTGSARADYLAGVDPISALNTVAEQSGDLGMCVTPVEYPSRDTPGEPLLVSLLRQNAVFGPALSSQSDGTMGSTGGVDSAGSGQQTGLASRSPSLSDETTRRLYLLYTYNLPPPFPSRLFRPPRVAM
jgi:hypothetical protein